MCSDVEAAAWQTLVNIPMLQSLLQATFSTDQALSFTQDSLWDVGQNRFPHLSHPKPGVAFGLAFANEGGSPLSRQLITDLVHVSGIPLTFCPSMQRLIYPSVVILEAKSAWGLIKVAESQLAVSAARALSLLAELSKLSAVPFQHCVVLIATQGSFWKLFVAYQDLDDRATVVSTIVTQRTSIELTPLQHIVPVLRSVLQIELERDRQRLAFIIHRLKAWMLGPYRSKISEQLSFVQENGLQQMQHLRPDQRLTSPISLIDNSLRYMSRTVHQSE